MSYDAIAKSVLQLSYEDKLNLFTLLAKTLQTNAPQKKQNNLEQFFGVIKTQQDVLAVQKALRDEWQ